jgi:predicted Fe-Mo cluster-binding NifX family protein
MKLIITSEGDNLKSKFDLRFGRSAWLCVFDSETKDIQFIENENKYVNGGAGNKTAAKVAELGAERVISGDFGPKAKSLLEKLRIQMVILDEGNKTVGSILEKTALNL